MRRLPSLACLAIALLLTGCMAKQKPVAVDSASLNKIQVGGTLIQRFVPEGGQTTVAAAIHNGTDYEIASISGILELYDNYGKLVDQRDVTMSVFVDRTTGYKGSLLPLSQADGNAKIPLDQPDKYPSYKFVLKGAAYYKKVDDYSDYGHIFAAIARHDPRFLAAMVKDASLIKAKDPTSQMTVLHEAAASNNLEVAQMVVKGGANINAVAMNGYTPLFEALAGGGSDVARFLIENGADVTGTHSQQTALQLASANCSNDIIDALLLKGADPNQGSANYPAPLIMAAAKGDIDMMKVLLKRGANINAANPNFGTVLHIAARTRNPQLVQLLVDRGADVNAVITPYRPLTPLMEAAAKGDGDTIRILLTHGAKKDAKGPNGRTALDYAEQYGNQEAIAALQMTNSK